MRVRRVAGVVAAVAATAVACGAPPAAERSALLDRAPTEIAADASPSPGVAAAAATSAAGGAAVTGPAPSGLPTVHATTGPSVPPPPPVPPAVPIGTVGAAPGIPAPLPAGAVALTFDDGPDPRWTPQVLAVLAQHHAFATFFDIGIDAQRYPSLVRAEYDAGNGVGNHSWSHPDLTKLTPDWAVLQIAQAASVITAATGGHAPVCLRPPYDAISQTLEELVAQQHEALMLYDGDPRDWQRPGAAVIAQRVLAEAHPGAVIDMHDAGGDRSQTVAALPAILDGLAARHLVTVPICRA